MCEFQMIEIYTDGSSIKNPGPSGWAFIMITSDREYHVSGGEKISTNNRMELTAVIESLKFLEEEECVIYTDSKLVLNCAQNIWKRKANMDLWEDYSNVSLNKIINWVWVKGHSGNKYNEMVDKLAKNESKNYDI